MFDADGIYGDLIMKSYFFLGIQHNDSAVMRICMELHATAALPGDDIYREGDIGDHMFFLLEGEVQQTTECREYENDESYTSIEQQEDEAAQKPHAQLLIKWEYSSEDVVFQKLLDNSQGEKASSYNAFREELGTVSGREYPFLRTFSTSVLLHEGVAATTGKLNNSVLCRNLRTHLSDERAHEL